MFTNDFVDFSFEITGRCSTVFSSSSTCQVPCPGTGHLALALALAPAPGPAQHQVGLGLNILVSRTCHPCLCFHPTAADCEVVLPHAFQKTFVLLLTSQNCTETGQYCSKLTVQYSGTVVLTQLRLYCVSASLLCQNKQPIRRGKAALGQSNGVSSQTFGTFSSLQN